MSGEAGWLLCEEEGLFPIAWAERIERLYPQLAALGGELLLVPEAALSTDLLDHLDDAGFRFITDASPARGRSWRALHKGSLRAWSNDHHGSAGPLQSAAERLESGASTSQALWLALTAERPGLPVGSEAGVERSLALAAALALGTIGWTLWREREAVTPLLALQRFADLDARGELLSRPGGSPSAAGPALHGFEAGRLARRHCRCALVRRPATAVRARLTMHRDLSLEHLALRLGR